MGNDSELFEIKGQLSNTIDKLDNLINNVNTKVFLRRQERRQSWKKINDKLDELNGEKGDDLVKRSSAFIVLEHMSIESIPMGEDTFLMLKKGLTHNEKKVLGYI